MDLIKYVDDIYQLKENCWAGAVVTLEEIIDYDYERNTSYDIQTYSNKRQELMELLEECFPETPTETEVNDFLWFERDYILEQLGIQKED